MTKLTIYVRDKIRSATIEAAFAKRYEDLKIRENILAHRCYGQLYSLEDLAVLNGVPNKWLNLSSNIRVAAGGYQVNLSFTESMAFTRNDDNMRHQMTESDLWHDIQRYAHDKKSCDDEKTNASNKVKAMLLEFGTVARMRQAWPEGEPYYKNLITEKAPSTLPVVQVAAVNDLLGLPIPTEAGA